MNLGKMAFNYRRIWFGRGFRRSLFQHPAWNGVISEVWPDYAGHY